jgi:hypothetical protein
LIGSEEPSLDVLRSDTQYIERRGLAEILRSNARQFRVGPVTSVLMAVVPPRHR